MARQTAQKGTKKPRLSKAQRYFVLSLLQDGLTSTEVNKACARYKPPFQVSDTLCTLYRKKIQVRHEQLKEQGDQQVYVEGFARKENRLIALNLLADRLMLDLLHKAGIKGDEKVWLKRLKGYGQGNQFFTQEYLEFNEAEFRQLRGLLDDIAKEEGHRSTRIDMTTKTDQNNISKFVVPPNLLAPSFLDAYRAIHLGKYTEYVFDDGRGSTKSSFVSLEFIELLINNPGVHGLAMRQVANTMRDSIYSQLLWAINELELTDKFKCTTSPLEIEYLPTHQKIYFRGADDANKIKSIKPAFGYIAVLWFEELDQFHGPEAVRKIEQSAIRGGDLAWIFKSYNPPRTSGNWVNKYVLIPKESQYQHKSNYLSVPAEWLGQVFLDEAEHLKLVNYPAYEHEYLGVVNGTGGQVFGNLAIRKITEKEIAQFDQVSHGIDWGFYPDPFAWVKVHYDAGRMTLYIFDELRLQKTGNEDAYKKLVKDKGLTANDLIIADSSEPKSVSDFRAYGANCRGAEKGPESVKYSMKWLQSLKEIVIDNERCPHSAEEFLNYELEQDKDENYISEYPDKNNHFIDATRYAKNLVWRRMGQ